MSVSVLNAPEEGQDSLYTSNRCEEVDLHCDGGIVQKAYYTSSLTLSLLIYKNTMKFVLRKHRVQLTWLHTLFSFPSFY